MVTVDDKNLKIGLALSGGGYRASAFHLGVFRKLHHLGLLDKVDVISTISGGSIAGAYYALRKNDFEAFEKAFIENLQKSTISKIVWSWKFWLPISGFLGFLWLLLSDPWNLSLPGWTIALVVGIAIVLPIIIQFRILSLTTLKIKAYKKIFFGNKTLSDLPDSPVLAINATNLSTGTLWTFSKGKSSDSSYEFPKDGGKSIRFDCGNMPIATAVASSTCVPIPFDPVLIPATFYQDITDFKRIKPRLIDGGLYDNQGIHKITQANSSYACDIIVVSDGSQPFPTAFPALSTIFILSRGIDVMMRKIKNLQFIRDVYSTKKEIAYFSLDWRYDRCIIEFIKAAKNGLVAPIALLHFKLTPEILQEKGMDELITYICNQIGFSRIIKNALSDEQIREVSSIRTNLSALKGKEIELLSRHGEILTEIQIKLYCPSLNRPSL
jgi:NTE family protein